MRKLLFAGILIACCAGPHLGRAAATPAIAAPNAAVSANAAMQKVYWYYWYGRRYWRPYVYRPYVYRPYYRPYYYRPYYRPYYYRPY
jgi:hypothetical protein